MIEIENRKTGNPNNKKKVIISVFLVICFVVGFIISFSLIKKDNNSDIPANAPIADVVETTVGKTFELEGLKFTIESYEFRYFAHKGIFPAGAGNVWLMVNAKIENPNTQRKKYDNITNSLYYITDKGEAKYNNKYYDYGEWILASNYLEPFEIVRGYYMFSLPENVAPASDGYSYSSGGKSTTTKGKNFEIRFQQNKTNPENIIKVKL